MKTLDKFIDTVNEWTGLNYFPYNNKLLFGPQNIKPTLITFTAISILIALFFSFESKYLADKWSIAIPIISAILYLITIAFLFIVAFSDPGIMLKKRTKTKELKPRAFLINQLGIVHKYKQCTSCAIIRPLRSNHCKDCDNCVIRFDHHCPWIGNCVGIRNYPFFYAFLLCLNILTIYLASFSIAKIVKTVTKNTRNDNSISIALIDNIISIYIVIYCGLAMMFITGLLIYHTNLVSNNITTKEELKKLFDNVIGNPYKRGFCVNWRNVIGRTLQKKNIINYLTLSSNNKDKEKQPLKISNETPHMPQILINPDSDKYKKENENENENDTSNNREKILNNEDIIMDFSEQNAIDLQHTRSNGEQRKNDNSNNSNNKNLHNSKDIINDFISSYYCDKSSFTARNRLVPVFKTKEISLFSHYQVHYSKSFQEKSDNLKKSDQKSEKILISFN